MLIASPRLLAITAVASLLFGGVAVAASNEGPEPYQAADPHYAQPMTQEPHITQSAPEQISLGGTENISGPAAGPEPYSAPTPQYTPMKGEPTIKSKAKH